METMVGRCESDNDHSDYLDDDMLTTWMSTSFFRKTLLHGWLVTDHTHTLSLSLSLSLRLCISINLMGAATLHSRWILPQRDVLPVIAVTAHLHSLCAFC